MIVFAIDPGNVYSAYCIIDPETLRPLEADKLPNDDLMRIIKDRRFDEADRAAIEMLQSYGMPVGKDVFETAVWIGRFDESLRRKLYKKPEMIYRKEEKLHICGSNSVGDAGIRRALIDRFCTHDFRTGRGTKKDPDFFYGISKDMWAAYAVGLVMIEAKMKGENT